MATDPFAFLGDSLDNVTTSDSLTAEIMEMVEVAMEQVRLLMTAGNDEARMLAIQKFLPMGLKVLQETHDTRMEEIREECRQMISEMLAQPSP